jgi:hypothetical protein
MSQQQQALTVSGNVKRMTTRLKQFICLLAFTVILLTSCFGLFVSSSDRIIGKYIVLWIDLPQNQTISE